LYFSFFSTYLFILIKGRAAYFSINKKTGFFLSLFILPWCIDGACNYFSLWSTPGAMRSVTGLLCGLPLPFLLGFIRNSSGDLQLVKKVNAAYFIIPTVFGSLLISFLVFTQSFFIFYALAFIAALGMLLFFSNMIRTFFQAIITSKVAISKPQLL
jgi:hypothetical protein